MSDLKPNIYCHATPANWDDSQEVQLRISTGKKLELSAIPRGEEHQKEGIVAFDQISRRYYAIRHFPCFSDAWDCCCAAQAKLLESKSERFEWPDVVFQEDEEE